MIFYTPAFTQKKSSILWHVRFFNKGRFFSESMMHFSDCPKNVPKKILKNRFWIVLCLESADFKWTAVSKYKA